MSEDTAEMKSDIHFMKSMLKHHWKAATIFMLGMIFILLGVASGRRKRQRLSRRARRLRGRRQTEPAM